MSNLIRNGDCKLLLGGTVVQTITSQLEVLQAEVLPIEIIAEMGAPIAQKMEALPLLFLA